MGDPVVTRAAQIKITKPVPLPLMPPFAVLLFCNFRRLKEIWRKRVGVEPTTRLAKSRIAGFEGREDHRIPFASAFCKTFSLQSLVDVRNLRSFDNWLRC